jgi:peptide/nickel transport system substrate-binding protein
VVIADKLQTYKAAKYSLVVQSDQYASDRVLFKTSVPGQTGVGGNQTQSGCLIATAAFGSEFAPQVQQLRQFRDNIALKTIAGSSFMNAFNLWYYSFSPAVADYERNTPWVRDAVRISIQPLLLILDASTALHGLIISAGMGDEFAIISVGLFSSSLIGLVYLSPGAVLIGLKRKRMLSGKTRNVIILSWCASALLIATGISGSYASLLGAGTVSLVLCSMITTTLCVSDRIAKL